ncbi:hypothetical protein AKJ43_01050 [candidate division MSBL1 archaeon SCGC-AAA261D19]|nr:hypothetical protein AKJ43_01050 [candidate division MSBL1 archaeon SCGC-AAA261D19]
MNIVVSAYGFVLGGFTRYLHRNIRDLFLDLFVAGQVLEAYCFVVQLGFLLEPLDQLLRISAIGISLNSFSPSF